MYLNGSFKTLSVLFLCFIVSVYGQTVQNAKDLRTLLFTTNSYDFRVRPISNQSSYVNVTVDFKLLNLNELDEVEETLKTTGYLAVKWTDSELTWTPASYGGLVSTFFPQDEIWKPDIALKNSYASFKELGTSKLNVEVSYQGDVEWYPFEVFTSTCSVDIRYFPFDVQDCHLKFVAWSYGKYEVFLSSSIGIDLYEYEESPSWEILETSFSEELTTYNGVITFRIKLKRKALYAMISMVFPIIVLTVLNLFVFVLPCESGEKAGYAITVFLTFAVFLTIVEAAMPENSTSIPIFSIFLIIMTTKSAVITMIALAMVRCSFFDEKITPIPKWLIILAKIGKLKSCRNQKWANKVNTIDGEEADETGTTDEKKMSDVEQNYSWKQTINGVDAFCFIVFSCFSLLATILCLGVSAGIAATQ